MHIHIQVKFDNLKSDQIQDPKSKMFFFSISIADYEITF
jgi:hypothetical protein